MSALAVGVLKETLVGERRVALVPDTVTRLQALGLDVLVEAGAGVAACFSDEAYGGGNVGAGEREQFLSGVDLFVVSGRECASGEHVVGVGDDGQAERGQDERGQDELSPVRGAHPLWGRGQAAGDVTDEGDSVVFQRHHRGDGGGQSDSEQEDRCPGRKSGRHEEKDQRARGQRTAGTVQVARMRGE